MDGAGILPRGFKGSERRGHSSTRTSCSSSMKNDPSRNFFIVFCTSVGSYHSCTLTNIFGKYIIDDLSEHVAWVLRLIFFPKLWLILFSLSLFLILSFTSMTIIVSFPPSLSSKPSCMHPSLLSFKCMASFFLIVFTLMCSHIFLSTCHITLNAIFSVSIMLIVHMCSELVIWYRKNNL